MDSIIQYHEHPAILLQKLIQYNTTNPPGNEAEIVAFIQRLLKDAGIPTQILAKSPNRPNLIARLPGRGDAPPLLLQGHVDVVTTAGQTWTHPPFSGEIIDGYVWGRGALDMKGGIAMMLAALLRIKAHGIIPPGDVLLTILSDEEAGSDMGAKFLVEEHPDIFRNVRYAIGEFGGFTLYAGGKTFYPIQVSEKQISWIRITIHGEGGHGSMPVRGGAVAKLGKILVAIDKNRLPVHITPVVRDMLTTMSQEIGGIRGILLKQLLTPRLTDFMLNIMGEQGAVFDSILHNTVSPTIIRGSDKINVIPSEVTVDLDGRLLPGQKPEDLIREVRSILGPLGKEVQIDVIRYDPGPDKVDMGWFDTLGGILKELSPQAIPVPLLLSGVTDARFFSRLGIQTYGFLPMKLPPDFAFSKTIHAADERVPVEAIKFGTEAIYRAIQRVRG